METAAERAPYRARRIPVWVVWGMLLGLVAPLVGGAGTARAAVTSHTVFFGGWEVGGFLSSTGHLVYCVEPGTFEPSGDQHAPVRAESLPGYSSQYSDPTGWNAPVTAGQASGDVLRRINWLLTVHGQTTNADTAAVVQLAVWLLREDPGLAGWVNHHVSWVASHGGAVHVMQAQQLAAEARAVTGEQHVGPDAPLLITHNSGAWGTGEVTYPSGTQSLDLEGAYFATGEQRMQTDGVAGTVSWSAPLHRDGWQREHRVSVSGDWQQETVEWPAAVMVHSPLDPRQQALGSMVGPVPGLVQSELDPASLVIDSQFSPVLTTQVSSRFVARGGDFADTVTFSVSEGSAPWAARQTAEGDTEFAPVVADGVLYGPFTHPLDTADAAPGSAPIAARVQLIADAGPGEYPVGAGVPVTEAGYYSWVWTVDEARQRTEVRAAALLPAGYVYSDRFGLPDEGQIVPTALRWSTALESRELAIDALTLRDRITVSLHDGAWLRGEDGARLPATIRLTVYGTEQQPQETPLPPESARELTRSFVTVTGVGEVSADPIPLPSDTRGWVSVQACLLTEDQEEASRGHFEEWCDSFGVPGETAQIVPPEVRTEAQPSVVVGEPFGDTAFVTGLVPRGAQLSFTYYFRPEAGALKYDAHWKPVVDIDGAPMRWTPEELAVLSDSERCMAQPVATTARIDVPAVGSYASPKVTAQSVGVGYWVETLTMPAPETDADDGADDREEVVIHRGECGLENERTIVTEVVVEPAPEAPLAQTGGSVDPRWGALGLIPVLSGLLLISARRRKVRG